MQVPYYDTASLMTTKVKTWDLCEKTCKSNEAAATIFISEEILILVN